MTTKTLHRFIPLYHHGVKQKPTPEDLSAFSTEEQNNYKLIEVKYWIKYYNTFEMQSYSSGKSASHHQ